MRLWFMLLILACVSCASSGTRKIASQTKIPYVPGAINFQNSRLQIFPAVADKQGVWYFFYLQLKDSNNHYLEFDASQISLRNSLGKNINFKYEKILAGRYYLSVEKTALGDTTKLDILLNGVVFRGQVELDSRVPDRSTSSIKILSNKNNVLTFELRLADKANALINPVDLPEIVIEGSGLIEEFRPISKGIWHFSLIYPEGNELMYFSVRAQGVYLSRILRYQHIEK